tara:strand:- start:158917 stop:159054 length:138 start_codon:yes stop_codon:yes gene_type:complete
MDKVFNGTLLNGEFQYVASSIVHQSERLVHSLTLPWRLSDSGRSD